MTYRHHYAELESQDDSSAIYRFTPDSIMKESWGRVKFSVFDYSAAIQEYANDPNHPEGWQDNVCSALASKFKKYLESNKGKIPKSISFIA